MLKSKCMLLVLPNFWRVKHWEFMNHVSVPKLDFFAPKIIVSTEKCQLALKLTSNDPLSLWPPHLGFPCILCG